MGHNETRYNDGLIHEFCQWFEPKTPFLMSEKIIFLTNKLSTSQNQAHIKFIEKKDRD